MTLAEIKAAVADRLAAARAIIAAYLSRPPQADGTTTPDGTV